MCRHSLRRASAAQAHDKEKDLPLHDIDIYGSVYNKDLMKSCDICITYNSIISEIILISDIF